MKIFLVGGAVRDILLGLEPKDKDFVVVGSSTEEMLSLGFTQVGKDFPVFLHPETGDEHALARKERSTGLGHTNFECETKDVTLEEDLVRRDLTVNSIAMDETGKIIDPFGGQRHIILKLLRHTSAAFEEDPLRVLRLARFHARFGEEWRVSSQTESLIEVMIKKGQLEHLVGERVWAETEKALMEPSPWIFFENLEEWLVPEGFVSETTFWTDFRMALRRAVNHNFSVEQRWALITLFFDEMEWFQKLFNKDKIPSKCTDLSIKFLENDLEDIGLVSAHETLRVFEKLDFFRKPQVLRDLLEVTSAIHPQCLSVTSVMICEIATKLKAVTARPFVEMGLTGQEIGDKMRLERLRIIQEILGENTDD